MYERYSFCALKWFDSKFLENVAAYKSTRVKRVAWSARSTVIDRRYSDIAGDYGEVERHAATLLQQECRRHARHYSPPVVNVSCDLLTKKPQDSGNRAAFY